MLTGKRTYPKTQSERVFGKIVWKSFDSKIASVSKNGVVKGKKIGNVLISAKLGDQYVGCVVSVTTAQIKKFVPEPVIWEKLEIQSGKTRTNGIL